MTDTSGTPISVEGRFDGLIFLRGDREFLPNSLDDAESYGRPSRHAVVLGSARGGTTACAKILSALGFVTDSPNVIGESNLIRQYVQRGEKDKILNHMLEWDSSSERWFLKEPKLKSDTFYDILASLPDTVGYLVVFRDILNISLRNRGVMGVPFEKALADAARANVKLVRTVEFLRGRDMALVSYEKLIMNPGKTVNAIARFFGVDEVSAIESAVASVDPASRDYQIAVQNRLLGGAE